MSEIIHVLELIGTVAFAVSGALVAVGAGLDLFGVVFVGGITAVGGGILRDLLLGIHPPTSFVNYHICLLAMLVALAVFAVAYLKRGQFERFRTRAEQVNNLFDALGLAAFSVTGAEVGYQTGFSENGFIIVVLGMLTGVGGGIFRDVLTDTTPYVFKKHIYALASICGSLLYFVLRTVTEHVSLASLVAMASVVAIRLLAAKYCWSLPKVQVGEKVDKI